MLFRSLTTGYSIGQIAGPLLVTPLLHGDHGYREALLIAAVVVALAAVAAGVLRHRFPHYLGPLPGRVLAAGTGNSGNPNVNLNTNTPDREL